MPLNIHSLRPAPGATKKRKRVGRGNASGHGTYSGRGLKGQKARSGVSGLKRKGMRQVLLRTPKKRGFRSLKAKAQIVKVSEVNRHFHDGDTVTPAALIKLGLIKPAQTKVKVLGPGKLTAKGLHFSQVALSRSLAGKTEEKKLSE
ncbi:MAG: 50S ribosomal protein L15 [Planctomycetes bacterium]|jgi:large subunit ribosomal protein L15|nr:50S ribosomal protein L15 [Planctomycetota bacterium]